MITSLLQPFFDAKGWQPFEFQKKTWLAHRAGRSGLLHASTGLGKTLAVYLGPLELSLSRPDDGCGSSPPANRQPDVSS